MTFNPTKSESIIFSRKRIKPHHPPVLMDYIQVNEVSAHKQLGVIFSNDCTWHDHLEHIKKKAMTRVNVMRKLKFKLDRRSLQTIYISFIRPLLEYADIVWDNCNLKLMNWKKYNTSSALSDWEVAPPRSSLPNTISKTRAPLSSMSCAFYIVRLFKSY